MWMPVDVQMNHGSSNVHAQWFSCQKKWSRQSWHHYVTSWDLLCWKGRKLYKESMTEPQGCCYCCLGVFWYKVFGLVSKPQTLYLVCLSALQGGSITRMNIATYLSICIYPDLSGGFSVSTTSVVWWQWGRSLPSPLEPGIEWSRDHNPSVANCEGRINC